MLLCTLVISLGAVLGCVAVSLHFRDLSFSAAVIFLFFPSPPPPTILMKFEQSREHQSPKWLIAFADYSAQANMEFFLSQVIFLLGQGKSVVDLFACSSYSVSPARALWDWFVPCAKAHPTIPSGVCKPTGGTGRVSHFISDLLLDVGVQTPALTFSHWLDPAPPWFPQQILI